MEKAKQVDGAPNGQSDGDHDEKDAIGYAKPPMATRFKSGQSGNRKGRPRGAKGKEAAVPRVLLEKRRVAATGTGRPRIATTLELTILLLKQLAAAGDQKAYWVQLDLARRYGESEPDQPVGYLLIPTVASREEWIEMFGPDGWAKSKNDE